MRSTEKDLIQADSTPVLDIQSANAEIPEYVIQRLAHFFYLRIQQSLQDAASAHLQHEGNNPILAGKEVTL